VSDECVRYTGLDIPALGISTGDSLKMVEAAITSYLVPLLTGTGDAIGLDISCRIVDEYLPDHTTNTQELFKAVVSAICSLQLQVFNIEDILAALNSDYVIGCLNGVTASSDTHAIVQAIITKLCTVETDLAALALDVDTNYVKLADLNALIAAYISGTGGSVQNYTKMVPYTAVEYYGTLSNFDGTGAGISALGWDRIYLCNGLNGTPDKRGRVAVGAILDVPGGPLNAAVDPIYTGNPLYEIYDVLGANTIALAESNLPSHTHIATSSASSTVNDPGHIHYAGRENDFGGASGSIGLSKNTPQNHATSSAVTGITVNTTVSVANAYVGSNVAHANIQPVLACYYIMYIPS
jgi:microcystin-dependent protein